MADDLKTVTVTPRYHEGTLTDGVLVPVLQALITSAILAALGLLLAVLLGAAFVTCVEIFTGVFLLALLGAWLSYRGHWMYIIESVLLADLNHDGQIGAPVQEDPKPILHISVDRQNGADYIDLPFADRLPELARGLAAGRPFTFAAWGGKGRLFSQPEWGELTAVMVERRLAVWKNPRAHNQGLDLSASGRAVFRRLAQPEQGGLSILQRESDLPAVYASETEPVNPPPWRR